MRPWPRSYLSGLGLAAYNETGGVSGVPLPAGLVEASRLPEPVFTPTTKAAAGHDEPMTYGQVADLVGAETAAELRRITLEVYPDSSRFWPADSHQPGHPQRSLDKQFLRDWSASIG